MKTIPIVAALVLSSVACWSADDLARPVATVTKVSGIVEAGVGSNWQQAIEGNYLFSDSRIRTLGSGRAEIRFKDGNIVRLAPSTEFRVGKTDGNTHSQIIEMMGGELLSKTVPGSTLEIKNALGAVRASNANTMVSMSGLSDKFTVTVTAGSASVRNKDGADVLVNKNEQAIVSTKVSPITLPISESQRDFRESSFKTSQSYRAQVINPSSPVQVGDIIPIQIKVTAVDSKQLTPYGNLVMAKSFESELGVSATQTNFEKSVELGTNQGVATFYVKATKAGSYKVVIGSEDISPIQAIIVATQSPKSSAGQSLSQAKGSLEAIDSELKHRLLKGTLSVNGFSNDIEVYLDAVSSK